MFDLQEKEVRILYQSQIYEELCQYTEAECIFKDAKLVHAGIMKPEELIQKYENTECKQEMFIALSPEQAQDLLKDQDFIRTGRNIGIMKHSRNMPLFYHRHDFFEIIYILQGEAKQYFEDETIELKKGDFCLLAPDVRHSVVEDGTALIINILVKYDTFMDIFMNMIREKSAISEFFMAHLYSETGPRTLLFHTEDDARIEGYILDLYEEQKDGDEFADRICCSLLSILFAQIIRRFEGTMEYSKTLRCKNEIVNEMIRYIIANYNTISIEKVAGEFHYSRQYCSRLLQEALGRTFQDFVIDIRVQQGKQYLKYTTMDIAQISELVGYANVETFIRTFKRMTGMTPSAFRMI